MTIANLVGVGIVSTQADVEAALQAIETWWTDGQGATPSSSADAAIDAATTGTLATVERAGVKAVWLYYRGAIDKDAI